MNWDKNCYALIYKQNALLPWQLKYIEQLIVWKNNYGISNQLGFMVGDSKFFGHQRSTKKTKSKLKDKTLDIYKQLTEK